MCTVLRQHLHSIMCRVANDTVNDDSYEVMFDDNK